MTTIYGIRLTKRIENSTKFQEILSKFGCNIKTRIGLHDVADGICSPDGAILLEVIGDEEILKSMADELTSFEGVKLQVMNL